MSPYADPEVRREYHKRYKQENRWRYQAGQKVYDAVVHANERAAQYGAPGIITADDVRAVLGMDKGSKVPTASCFYCRGPGKGWLGIDHRVALARGGLNTRANLVPCCHSCNASKMRGDRPHRWSWKFDACVQCGQTDKKHIANGRCSPCYWREYEATHRDRPRGGKARA